MTAATSTSEVSATSIIDKHIQALREIHDRKSLENEAQGAIHYSKSEIVDCIDELEKLSDKLRLPVDNVVVGSFKEGRRYLCISNGFVICCLDLEQSKDKFSDNCLDLQPLPTISTLKLLEKGLPISMGLFKLGAEAYMIGGQQFPEFKMDCNLWGLKLADFLYQKHGLKGTSRDTYSLSLANGSLFVTQCKSLGKMNKPKFWPIVEKIGDQVHVIEYLPRELSFHTPDTIPSHEVLNLTDVARGWRELPPTHVSDDGEFNLYVRDHLVIGDRIYARPTRLSDRCMVFDSKTGKWEMHQVKGEREYDSKHIGSIFGAVLGLGARRFMLQGEPSDPIYVVFTMKDMDEYNEAYIKACLVTSTGQVLCEQEVKHIFEGFKRRFLVSQGTLIDVDEEGKTMCVVLHGITTDVHREEFLFICTFAMEETADARSLMQEGRRERYKGEREFVNVVVKQRYVYNTHASFGEEGDIGHIIRLGACFL